MNFKIQRQQGSILVLFIPSVFILVGVSFFVVDYGRLHYQAQHLKTVAEATLLSSLRLRVEALERIATRWSEWGHLFAEGNHQGAVVPFEKWDLLRNQARRLYRALPGYKGRIRAVIRVVANANGVAREAIHLRLDQGLHLGLLAQPVFISAPGKEPMSFDHIWYQRDWAPADRLGSPDERCWLDVRYPLSFLFFNESREGGQNAAGSLQWDVDLTAPEIRQHGNGGYPRDWSEAIVQGEVQPHRYPLYRAVLHHEN